MIRVVVRFCRLGDCCRFFIVKQRAFIPFPTIPGGLVNGGFFIFLQVQVIFQFHRQIQVVNVSHFFGFRRTVTLLYGFTILVFVPTDFVHGVPVGNIDSRRYTILVCFLYFGIRAIVQHHRQCFQFIAVTDESPRNCQGLLSSADGIGIPYGLQAGKHLFHESCGVRG